MKRKVYDKLLEWKNNKNRKPLIVYGANKIGKTYIIEKFCEKEFKNFYKVNLFNDDILVNIYENSGNADDKFKELLSRTGITDINKDTVLFIDEIQESPSLISSLKYFCEEHPDLNIICAGSLLGIALKRNKDKKSFPVGKIYMLDMYQMDFEEYLMAFDEYYLIDKIKESYKSNTPLIEPLHNKALQYYNRYLFTGGMPEAVKNIINVDGNTSAFDDNILKDIVSAYFEDMTKYVENNSETMKIQAIYNTIPMQLSNESHRFQYSKIKSGASSRDYELPLDWLISSRIILQSFNVKTPSIPVKVFFEPNTFKIYLNDVGLLRIMSDLSYLDITSGIYNGILAENYVAVELKSSLNKSLSYYKNESSTLEIDFLLQCSDGIIPIEVKSSDNTQSKSLKTYVNKFNPKYSIRVSSKNFGFVNNIKSVPLYAVFCINDKNLI